MAKESYLSWTFLQSSYWSAILEILLCWVLLLTGLWFFRKEHSTSIAFAFTVILTFCFLHQYSAALLAGCFYTLFICLLGSFICRVLHIPSAKSWAVVFVMGIAGTLILIAGASLLRLGTPRKLRFIFAALLVVLLFLERSSVRIFFKKRFAQSDAVYQPLADMKYLLLNADFMSDDSWTAEIMRSLAETGRVTTSLLNEHWALVKISPSSGSPDSALLDWFGTVSSIPESSQKLQ